MRRPLQACPLLVAALAVLPGVALAKFPSPANSTVSHPLVVCPRGDSLFVFIGRNANNNPTPGAEIVVDLSACPGVRLARVQGDEPYQVDSSATRITASTDAMGYLAIPVRAGGTAPAGSARIFGDGVLQRLEAVASPDQDGDLVVDAADVAAIESKLGTADPAADFDRDGVVGPQDVAIVQAHLGHAAPGTDTPVFAGTWGRIKRLYR